MAPWLLGLSLLAVALEGKTLGVPPSLLSRYTPSNGDRWTCLDGSREIAWSAVNDDYCDCPDGSDEPGLNLNFVYSRCLTKGIFFLVLPKERVLALMDSFTAPTKGISGQVYPAHE